MDVHTVSVRSEVSFSQKKLVLQKASFDTVLHFQKMDAQEVTVATMEHLCARLLILYLFRLIELEGR